VVANYLPQKVRRGEQKESKLITKVSKIDGETGEILKDSTYYSDSSSVNYNTDSGFKKLYVPLPTFTENLHFASWVQLLPYVEYQTNRLVIKKNSKMKIKDMINIIKMGKTFTYRFIKESDRMNVMKKYQGAYYMNPRFVMNGKKINIELIDIFKEDSEFNNRIPKHERCIAYKLLGALNERTQVPC
tara:strand:- start:335 stop:895 length:561 start_codon:yes stop_codon:yes gene_type:complete